MADEQKKETPEEQAPEAQTEDTENTEQETESPAAEEATEEEEAQEAAPDEAEQAETAAESDAAEAEESDEEEEEGEAVTAEETDSAETEEDEEEEVVAEEEPAEEEPAEETKEAPAAKTNGEAIYRVAIEDLLKAGAHFGHQTSRWDPKMKPFIFMERNGIHIIDLMQTQVLLEEGASAAERFARRGKTVLFVGTKKQAKEIVRSAAEDSNSPYVVERWLGGMLTNFQTIRLSIRRMEQIEKMEKDGTFEQLKKKERLMKMREREKLERNLSGIAQMARLPGALFVVDVSREHIAVAEARKLGIPIIAMVDTNTDPDLIDFPIPANDDALKSIETVTNVIAEAVQTGNAQRQAEEQAKKAEKQKQEA